MDNILDSSIIYIFNQLAGNFKYQFDWKLKKVGLHGGQVFVLISLWKIDRQSQAELAKSLNLSSPTVHKMINSLERGGFVKSMKCPNDNRLRRIHLTQKGIEYQKIIEQIFSEFEQELFSDLTITEKLIFQEICQKLEKSSAE